MNSTLNSAIGLKMLFMNRTTGLSRRVSLDSLDMTWSEWMSVSTIMPSSKHQLTQKTTSRRLRNYQLCLKVGSPKTRSVALSVVTQTTKTKI